jgi:hypothetical protein
MNPKPNWLLLYLDGHKLERSLDRVNWVPIIEEPMIGDGWHYRKYRKENVPHTS